MASFKCSLSRTELFQLHDHYSKVLKDELDFCFRYLHFYIGLLSAILAATLTGLFKFELSMPTGLAFLLSPVLMVGLAWLGYKTVEVFYRRHIEAWITTLNIETMLGLRQEVPPSESFNPPPFVSNHDHGFIVEFERQDVRDLLNEAIDRKEGAEKLLPKILKTGVTLRHALYMFIMFGVAALIVGGAIVSKLF